MHLRDELRRLEGERLALQAQVATLAAELTAVLEWSCRLRCYLLSQAHRLTREERMRRMELQHDVVPVPPKPGAAAKINMPTTASAQRLQQSPHCCRDSCV